MGSTARERRCAVRATADRPQQQRCVCRQDSYRRLVITPRRGRRRSTAPAHNCARSRQTVARLQGLEAISLSRSWALSSARRRTPRQRLGGCSSAAKRATCPFPRRRRLAGTARIARSRARCSCTAGFEEHLASSCKGKSSSHGRILRC